MIGEQAQATIVESYLDLAAEGAEPLYFSCGVTELVAGPGAVVDHYKVQRESREAFHVATFELVQAARRTSPRTRSRSAAAWCATTSTPSSTAPAARRS